MNNIYSCISTIILLVNIIFIITAVFFERKKPVQALSWLLTLSLLPLIGFVLYLIFGRPFHLKKKKFLIKCDRSKKYCQKLHNTLEFPSYEKATFIDTMNNEAFIEEIKQIVKFNINTSNSSFTIDNRVDIFTSAEHKYRELLQDIKAAKSSIHIVYFIFKNDSIGKKIINALADKAQEGLEVRLLLDHGANLITPFKAYKSIIDNGGEVLNFFSNSIRNYLRANYRNHRKIVIIDGKIGYIGGINIGDEYLGLHKKITPWRDTHLKIVGSSVYSLQLRFFEDWLYVSKKEMQFTNTDKYFMPVDMNIKGNTGVQIISSGPDTKGGEIKRCLSKMINSAKKQIFIQTPYFVPDDSFLEAIQNAAMSGVEVIMQIPEIPDKPYVHKASMSFVADIISYGVKVYMYKGFLHAKMLVVDDACCSIGTANIDIRSFYLNFEINAFMYGKEITQRCIDIFNNDLKSCKLILEDDFRRRSVFNKIEESIFRLLSPIL